MAKFYLFATMLLTAASMSAQPLEIPGLLSRGGAPEGSEEIRSIQSVKMRTVAAMSGTRSVDEPETEFVASNACYYVYEDGLWYIFLSNTGLDKGNPTTEGQYMRILLQTDPVEDPSAATLPIGVFEGSDEFETDHFIYGYSLCMDIFENPDAPGSGELVAYQYAATDGVLEISYSDGEYHIMASFLGLNDYGEGVDERVCKAEYAGEVPYVDINAYTPLAGDVEFNPAGASGRYTEGNYSIAFYSDGMLDEEGWIVDAGQLLNMDLFVPNEAPMNPEAIVGTYTPVDVMNEGEVPGCFVQGIWYEMFGMYVPMGTRLAIYDKYGDMTNVGLAAEGSITVSREGDDYIVAFDLITVEGSKITGQWKGDLMAAVTDFSDPTGVESIDSESDAVFGEEGRIVAPENAVIYNMTGRIVGASDLSSGVYVVKHGNRVKKVFVK